MKTKSSKTHRRFSTRALAGPMARCTRRKRARRQAGPTVADGSGPLDEASKVLLRLSQAVGTVATVIATLLALGVIHPIQ